MNLKKVLYENYGIVIKKSEEMFWNHIVNHKSHQKLSEALEEFSSTTELQYFNHRHFNDIANCLIKEEISIRDRESGYNPKDSQNITASDILYYEYDVNEEALDTEKYEDENDPDAQHIYDVHHLVKKLGSK